MNSSLTMNDAPAKGTLYLVPAPLDFGCDPELQTPICDVIPSGTLARAAQIQHWIGENAKSTRAVLKRIAMHHPLCRPLQEMSIQELPRAVHKKGDHSAAHDDDAAKTTQAMLSPALQGFDMGLMSEAGMPAVADPGSSIVRAAHALGVDVVPLIGPVSLLLALAASGLNGQHFAFHGYLPQDPAQRRSRIAQLDHLSAQTGQTHIVIETPYRNAALLNDLILGLQPRTRLSCSMGLTLRNSKTISQQVKHWRNQPEAAAQVLKQKLPAVFVFGV